MEEAVNELKMANLTVHKLGETFDAFQSQAFSIAALSEQWQTLKGSFAAVGSSLLNRVKEIESKERGLVATEKRIENLEREVELKRKRVDQRAIDVELSEKRIRDRYEVVKMKEKEVITYLERKEKEMIARFDVKATAIDARSKALEVKEKELTERFESRSREIEGKATAVDKRSRDLVVKEKELIERFKEKEIKIDERSKDLELKEKKMIENFEKVCEFEVECEKKKIDIDNRLIELELKEKEMNERFEELKVLELREKEVDEQIRVLVSKEGKLNERINEYNAKAERVDAQIRVMVLKERELNERIDEYNVKIEGVDEQVRVMVSKERKLNERIDEYNVKEAGVDEQVRVMASKEMELNERIDEYNVKIEGVDEQARVMASKEMELNERIDEYNVKVTLVDEALKEIEVKEKQLARRKKVIELKEKDLDDKFRGCELRMEENDKFCRELDSKEREIEEHSKMLELKEKDLDDKLRGCELRMEENDKFCRELDSKEREIEERSKMLELREKEMNEKCQALELIKKENDERSKMLELREVELKQDSKECNMNGNHICGKLHTLCRDMDANCLTSYLNEHVNDLNELQDEVLDALRFASSPAKLVLDVCKTFHGPYLAKLVITNNHTSFVYLLELLMKLEPEITLDVSNEARKFADVWRSRLGKCDDTQGNFGFLLFLAAFKLSGSYEIEVIAEHLIRLYSEENIYQVEKHVTLCNALGIADNVPDIIQNLIHKNQPLEAIRLAHTFKLFHQFPPVPLLESYLSSTITRAEVRRRRDPSKEAQIKYLTTKIGALNFVVRCIKKYNLMSEYPIQPLENLSLKLKRERLGLTRVSSLGTWTKSLTASADPATNDTSGNSTSLTPFQATMNEVQSHDFVHSSVTSGSIQEARLQSMSRNKRPRLSVIQRHEPVNPHLVRHSYIPACNSGAVPSYGNYTRWLYNARQSLHHR